MPANRSAMPPRVKATGYPDIRAKQMLMNSRMAMISPMLHLLLCFRQTTGQPIAGLDQVGKALQGEAADQQQDDAFLQVDELQPDRLVGAFMRRPGTGDVVHAVPAEEQADRQQKTQVAKDRKRTRLTYG